MQKGQRWQKKLFSVNFFVLLKFLFLLLLPHSYSYSDQKSNHGIDNYNTVTMTTRMNDEDCKSEAKSKLLHFDPPDLEIVWGNWTKLLKLEGQVSLNIKFADTGFELAFSCKGLYLVQLLYQLDNDQKEARQDNSLSTIDTESFRNKVFYSNSSKNINNFYNHSTYEFYVRDKILFKRPKIKNNVFSCRGLDQPCLEHTAEFVFSSDSTQLNISLLPKSKLGYPLPFIVDPPDLNHTDCEAFYYYQKLSSGDTTDTYSFRCEFADESPGRIQRTQCEHKMRCRAMERHRPEIKGCWRVWNGELCRDCQVDIETRYFASFIATCQKGVQGTSSYVETSTSSLAFYGVPKGENQTRPDIFFNESQVVEAAMIYLKPVPVLNDVGDVIHAECLLSGYYTSASFQFALEYEKDGLTKLELVPQPFENQTNWVPSFGGWQQKIRIPLNHRRITRVYCFGQIQNTYMWINVSIPIQYWPPVSSSKLVVTLVSSLLAVAILVIGIIWFIFSQREERLLGELTEEQITEFKRGRSNLEIGNRSSIYCRVYNQNFEVSRHAIEIQTEKLGEGDFGVVYKGYLKRRGQGFLRRPILPKVEVAVKTMKRHVDVGTFLEFLGEIKIMTYLGKHDNANVVRLIAACTSSIKKCEAYACLEYCEYGNLKDHLNSKIDKNRFLDLFKHLSSAHSIPSQSNSNDAAGHYLRTAVTNGGMVVLTPFPRLNNDRNEVDLSTVDLLTIAHDVANGLDYLAEKKIIHGDVAARNIMLAPSTSSQSVSRLEAKIGDFGLSSQLDRNSNYIRKEAHRPWKWSSPEVLSEMLYYVESDVWSYGALLYELFTLGDDPWPNVHEFSGAFTQKLYDGHRLEKPDLANASMYNLMLRCWDNERRARPSCAEIKNEVLQELQKLCLFHDFTQRSHNMGQQQGGYGTFRPMLPV